MWKPSKTLWSKGHKSHAKACVHCAALQEDVNKDKNFVCCGPFFLVMKLNFDSGWNSLLIDIFHIINLHTVQYTCIMCTVRAPVFGRHQFFGTSEHYGKAHTCGSLLSGWMNYKIYTACCWFSTSGNILIQVSITILTNQVLKVADCTVESAEYWCLYGTKQELELMYTKIVHLYFALLRTVLMLHVHVSMHCTCAQQAFKLKWSKLPMRRKTQSLFTKF